MSAEALTPASQNTGNGTVTVTAWSGARESSQWYLPDDFVSLEDDAEGLARWLAESCQSSYDGEIHVCGRPKGHEGHHSCVGCWNAGKVATLWV